VSAGVHVLAPGQKVRIYEERTAGAAAVAARNGGAAAVNAAAVQPVASK
jgi:hypothetical protein